MKLYQIRVKGYQAYFNDYFKASSKKVYKRKPTEEEIKAFLDSCTDEKVNPISVLDTEHEYEVKILELELVEE